jgi:hypothetical protein
MAREPMRMGAHWWACRRGQDAHGLAWKVMLLWRELPGWCHRHGHLDTISIGGVQRPSGKVLRLPRVCAKTFPEGSGDGTWLTK